jgi:DHA2 family multidrug resistance protein-like MFS transporter
MCCPPPSRELSYWSIGSWGGSGASALFGGLVASSVGWRWIFWLSILVAMVSFLLIKGTPESKVESGDARRFDWYGFTAFITGMVAVNVVIGQSAALGWLVSAHRESSGARRSDGTLTPPYAASGISTARPLI